MNPHLKLVGKVALVALGYFFTGWLVLRFAALGSDITLLWLPTGVGVAALLRYGFNVWPGILLGAAGVCQLLHLTHRVSLSVIVGNTLACVVAAWLLKRLDFHPTFDRKRDILLLALSGGLGMLISSVVGVTSLLEGGFLPITWLSAVLLWWGGDTLGVIIATPLLLSINFARVRSLKQRPLEFFSCMTLTCLTAWLVFIFNGSGAQKALAIAFIPLPLVAWASLRFAAIGTSLALIIVSTVAAFSITINSGPFMVESPAQLSLTLWLFMATTATLGWIITSLQAEKVKANDIQRLLEQALNEISLGVLLGDTNRRITYVNTGFTRLTGYSEGELLGQSCSILQGPQTNPQVIEALQEKLHGDGFFAGDILNYRKDGTTFWNGLLISPLHNEQGEKSGFIGIQRDISEQKQLEEQVVATREYYQALVDKSHDLTLIFDQQGIIRYVNPASKEILGFAPEEMINQPNWNFVHPEDAEKNLGIFQKQLASPGSVVGLDIRIRHLDGTYRLLDAITTNLTHLPAVSGIVANCRDITERRQIDEARKESELKYRRIVETSQEGIWLIDADNRTTFVNQRMSEILGYKAEGMIGETLFNFMDEAGIAIAQDNLERRRQGFTEQHDFKFRHKNGSDVWVMIATNPLLDENQAYQGALAMVSDITQRRKAEQERQQVLERISEAVVALDNNWNFSYVNPQAGVILNRDPEELIGKNIWEEFPEVVGHPFQIAYEKALQDQCPAHLEEYYPHCDRWFESYIYPSDEGISIYFQDITARKRNEEKILATNSLLQATLDAIPDPLLEIGLDGKYYGYQTPHFELLTNSPEYVIGKTVHEVLPPEAAGIVLEALQETHQTGFTQGKQIEIKLPTGNIWFDLSVAAKAVAPGEAPRFIVLSRDITSRKLAEDTLRESERRLATVIANLPGYVYRVANDKDYTPQYISEGVENITGYAQDDYLVARTITCGAEIHPDDSESVWQIVQTAVAAGEPYECEYRIYTKTGELRWVWERGRGNYTETGELSSLEGFVTDITGRKQAAEALRKSEENLNITLASIGDAVIATDAEGRVTRMNTLAEAMTGWKLNEAAGQPLNQVFRIINSQTREPIADPVQIVLEQGITVGLTNHTSLISLDGVEYHIADSAAPIRDQTGHIWGVVLVFSDVSEKYQIQLALLENEKRLRAIIENEPECVKVVAADGALLEMNPAGLAMLEAESLGEAIKRPLGDYILPEYRVAFWELHRRVINGETGVLEFELMGLKGTRRWLETHAAPMTDATGAANLLLGVTRDITQRKIVENEKAKIEVQLRQAQKMEAIGQLAGGVAHDFNNLLTIINGRSALALQKIPESNPLHSSFEEIYQAGERAAALTRQLLTFSRAQSITPEILDLNKLVAESKQILRRLIREDIELVFKMPEGLSKIKADKPQMGQVVMNLVINASDAMPLGGKLTVQTENFVSGVAHEAKYHPGIPGDYVLLSVSDTGIGMDKATSERIFDPFFTTKELGHGTGLGLSTVYGIITQNGGTVTVESKPGQGTTFRIYLPLWESEVAPPQPSASISEDSGGETILVVDDEESIVNLAKLILETEGYTVLTATFGEEALRVIAGYHKTIHLLLTDVVIPGMSGPELAAKVKEFHPKIKVLYASGYADETVLKHGVSESQRLFINKPYTIQELIRKVHESLNSSRLNTIQSRKF